MERVDEDRGIVSTDADHEVSRQVHARHRQPEPLGDRQVERRERDGDAELAVEHFVQVAVAGVLIILDVASKPFLDEQHPVDLAEDVPHLGTLGAAIPNAIGQVVDAREVGASIERGVGIARQLQAEPRQVGFVLAPKQAEEFRAV